ncbi:MAG TPA: hypothetical protein VF329_02055 [Gammaproteobacteria bacterium]
MTSVVHALRQIRLRPGLSAIVILMLAIGIGASTAVFSVFHEILLRPLPVLAAVVLGTGYLPARRASNLAPMDALRHE